MSPWLMTRISTSQRVVQAEEKGTGRGFHHGNRTPSGGGILLSRRAGREDGRHGGLENDMPVSSIRNGLSDDGFAPDWSCTPCIDLATLVIPLEHGALMVE